MSIQAFVWVIEHSQSRLADRCVLMSIANHCDRQGMNAWPSVNTISHEAKVSPRQVQVSTRRLCRMGELSIAKKEGRYGTNVYRLPMMREGNPALLAEIPEPESRGAKSAGVENLRGANLLSGAYIPTPKRQNSSPEPSLEPSSKPPAHTPCTGIPKTKSALGKPGQPPDLPEGALIPTPDPWSLILAEVKATVDRQSYNTWFAPTRLGYVLNGTLVVRVPNRHWEYMLEHYRSTIEKAVTKLGLACSRFELEPDERGSQQGGSGKAAKA